MKKIRFAFILLGFMAVTACGGGGGGGATSSVEPPATAPPAATAAGTAAATPAESTPTAPAAAGVAKLAWDAPAGDAAAVRGFKVGYGTVPGTYTNSVDVGMATTFSVEGLSPGRYYFAVAAYDEAGNQSGYSNEVTKDV